MHAHTHACIHIIMYKYMQIYAYYNTHTHSVYACTHTCMHACTLVNPYYTHHACMHAYNYKAVAGMLQLLRKLALAGVTIGRGRGGKVPCAQWSMPGREGRLTNPNWSRWLFVILSFWKEMSCFSQMAPVAGESGWTQSRPGRCGSAFPSPPTQSHETCNGCHQLQQCP